MQENTVHRRLGLHQCAHLIASRAGSDPRAMPWTTWRLSNENGSTEASSAFSEQKADGAKHEGPEGIQITLEPSGAKPLGSVTEAMEKNCAPLSL